MYTDGCSVYIYVYSSIKMWIFYRGCMLKRMLEDLDQTKVETGNYSVLHLLLHTKAAVFNQWYTSYH